MMKTLNNSFVKYGLPFLSFIVLGSLLLREFTSIRYDISSYKRRYMPNRRRNNNYVEEINETDINEQMEMQKIINEGKNNDWKNIRGPRPWEDNTEYNKLVNDLKNKKKN